MTCSKAWVEIAEGIVSKPGKTLVLGESDTGKSSFSILLSNSACKKGMKVSILDLDVGQSHVGPPTTIGLGIVDTPIDPMGTIEPTSTWFVGSDSPASSTGLLCDGVKTLLQRAKKLRVEHLIVNTSGYVRGKKAGRFKMKIVRIVGPDQIVILERHNELSQLAEEIGEIAVIHRVRVPREIKRKSKRERRKFRESLWERYLNGAQPIKIGKNRLLNAPESSSSGLRGIIAGLFDESRELSGIGVVSGVIDERVVVFTKLASDKVVWLKFGKIKVARRFLT